MLQAARESSDEWGASRMHTFWLGRLGTCSHDLTHCGAIAVLGPSDIGLPVPAFWAVLVARQPVGQGPAATLHMHP